MSIVISASSANAVSDNTGAVAAVVDVFLVIDLRFFLSSGVDLHEADL